MYFVTINHPEYVLFTTTPRGHAAIGLTERGLVRLLKPGDKPRDWQTLREWPASVYSHTDLMTTLSRIDEPERAEQLLAHLPADTLT